MINRKAKGTKGERELVQFFNENNWACIRAAGSGSSRYPSPDLLAANAIRRLAIECKVTKDQKKYFSKDEIEQLKFFSQHFGAESWIGVKFAGEEWYFMMIEDLESTGSLWAVDVNLAKRRGLKKEELVGNVNTTNSSNSTS
ncbi:Holliday junction resolvase [Candidatus Woesearchaeota archaeon]|nr:Holliday junction resolvase [Candidatus Woesearchaeota archaeon]